MISPDFLNFPIFELQSMNAAEFRRVVRHQNQLVLLHDRRNLKIMWADDCTNAFEVTAWSCACPGTSIVKW